MSAVSLTRRVTFTASHRLRRADWSDEKNLATFGDSVSRDHSHTYTCDVTVTGPIDAETSTIIDLRELDRALRAEIVERLDGHSINDALPEYAKGPHVPTGESLACILATNLQRALGSRVKVSAVTVAENSTLSATWRLEG